MIIAVLNESANDTRVAMTPNMVKHYLKLGLKVQCEKNAGIASGFTDKSYEEAGAAIVKDRKQLLQQADILACVQAPDPKDLDELKSQALLIAPLDNEPDSPLIKWCMKQSISAFSMNLVPRITRAQGMDSLSSQANLAGYRAVLEAVCHFKRAIPMMMTAAGMIHPAKILILGAGVAGLQAIATAKRLGGVIYAFDVRRAAKEQVESLGAEFIEVEMEEDSETSGGYAKEMSEDYKRQQSELIAKYVAQSDIVVTTALIPGRQAPLLITKTMVETMKPGSVIVDLATSRGGNCELSQCDKVALHNEVTIIGYSNMAGFIPATASELYANNILNLVKTLATSPEALDFKEDDEIMKQALLCHQNKYLPFQSIPSKETVHA
ncbi:Re/Si-specific NAD(P)(+) transhydrogenase subunit alpha [Legionella spiritensis]|uniref:NAD(P) transhydrogenase subunit alpha part 1 n=1 Tax=Legionella spiritensis TaxID=452 RepID=A0A0W0Z2W3_LEGSP|nr:Re/Si-specific NAD(P)(+) transhydrogenase subunit alpha [Legionella spiritensis]KTD63477.1 pyridine nucleotide transhydrogenase, alpha subunit [Legionella spiritensis]SNV36173.1 NAD(P) transhydrogenase subunit alpha [Legionella spiritensis]